MAAILLMTPASRLMSGDLVRIKKGQFWLFGDKDMAVLGVVTGRLPAPSMVSVQRPDGGEVHRLSARDHEFHRVIHGDD